MKVPWGLALRHVRTHWFRNMLTIGAVSVAVFLFCFLVSLIVTLDAQVEEASVDRLVVKSAVSLFVDLPLDYQTKIANVPGVELLTKWQWFGGYYQDPNTGFFAQFAVDVDPFFEMYENDIEILEAPAGATGDLRIAVRDAMRSEKRGALVGATIANKFGWKVGDTIPLICTIFPKTDGTPWDFKVLGIYGKKKQSIDDQTLFFRFDYFEDTVLGQGTMDSVGTGTFFVQVAPGASAKAIDDIDALFHNGPQRTKTTTEGAFMQGFVSMLGNLPLFLGTIGGAVVFAVFFSVVNAMLIAGRQRIRESGIMKALGFSNSAIGTLIVFESLLLTGLGGLLGIALTLGLERAAGPAIQGMFPNFGVEPRAILLGAAIALGIGVIAGIAPSLTLMRLRPTEALRSDG